MEVKWAIDAKNDYHNALDYWYEHNGSFTYSAKIIQAVEALEYDLANNPYFVERYSKSLNLYCRTILKGRFLIYFDVNEKGKSIEIVYFRSSKQESIE
ncbi:type II toxin-antitoxin system RelE/ParE family toxin [Capnocytophaga granulosa]